MSRAPFSRRTLTTIISFGVGTLVLGFLLSAVLPGLYGDRTAGPSSYSRSLQGHHALVEWLRRLDFPVVRCRAPLALGFRKDFPVLLIEPIICREAPSGDLETHNATLTKVLLRRIGTAGASAVVVLPKRSYVPDPRYPVWVGTESLDRSSAEDVLERALPDLLVAEAAAPTARVCHPEQLTDVDGSPLGIAAPVVEIKHPQVLASAARLEPLLHCREGVLIGRIRLQSGLRAWRYVISDPDLLNNRGLGRGDHAALVHALLADVLGADGVVVDESLHGFLADHSVLARAFSFPLALIVLHALLLAGLFAWAAATRFGKALTPPPGLPPGKTLLLLNTGKLFLAAGDHGGAVRRYLRASMTDVAERFAFGEVASGRDLVERVAALTRARGLAFDLPEIARAARGRNLTPAAAVELALEVRAWRTALLQPGLLRAGHTEKLDRPRPRQRPGAGA